MTLVAAARALGAGDLTRARDWAGATRSGCSGRRSTPWPPAWTSASASSPSRTCGPSRALAAAVDAKDPYTHGHSQRVSAYAPPSRGMLELDPPIVAEIEMGGLLHDVGKIGMPDGVLTKPGKLDDDEWAQIRKHPETGAEILRPVGFGPVIMNVVPLPPRAAERARLPARPARRRDPARGADRGRLRRLRRDDLRPLLSALARPRQGAVDELRKRAATSSTPPASRPSPTRSTEPLPSGVAQEAYAGPARGDRLSVERSGPVPAPG